MLFSEQVEDEGQNDADDNAGGEGKVEAELLLLNVNIPRKLANPGNF